MKLPAMYEKLVINSHRKDIWTNLGIESVERQFNILYAVLLYIKEKSLLEETCTEQDVADYISTIINSGYGILADDTDILRASRVILQEIFANSGSVMTFPVADFNEGGECDETIRFLETSSVVIEGRRRVSYRLSDDAYLLIFSGKEIPDQMQMNMHTYIIGMHLRKQSYGSALEDGKELLDHARARRQLTQNEAQRIRRNPDMYNSADLIETCDTNIEAYNQISTSMHHHRQMVETQIDNFMSSGLRRSSLDEKQEISLANLKKLNECLGQIEEEMGRLIIAQQRIKTVFLEEMKAQLSEFRSEKIAIKDVLLTPVLKNPDILYGIIDILYPMLIKEPDDKKIFNLQLAFDMRDLEQDTEEEEFTDSLVVDKEAEIAKCEENARAARKQIAAVTEPLLQNIIKNPNGFLLSSHAEYLKDLPGDERQTASNRKIIKNLLVDLYSRNDLTISEVRDWFGKDKALISLKEEMMKAAIKYGLTPGDKIEITRLREKPKAVFEYFDDAEMTYEMKCTEMLFVLKRRDDPNEQ